jgi:acetaldehyde dehydrogenase
MAGSEKKKIAAIVGPGNIGTDLLIKLQRSAHLDVKYMVGIDPDSRGLREAEIVGVETSSEGVPWLLSRDILPDIVFEATSASAHERNAPLYAEFAIKAIDLTPARVGPMVCPVATSVEILDAPNVNLITCGGQATVPIVHAVSRITRVPYAEIVASIASRSAGPGTRQNIDEFTETTALALESVGGAERGKAIIILNPVEPPMVMRDTVFCAIERDADREAISESIAQVVAEVASYVPGYRLRIDPQFDDSGPGWGDGGRVGVFLEIEGAGDYLPPYAGNLDIMTAAAVHVGEMCADRGGFLK